MGRGSWVCGFVGRSRVRVGELQALGWARRLGWFMGSWVEWIRGSCGLGWAVLGWFVGSWVALGFVWVSFPESDERRVLV